MGLNSAMFDDIGLKIQKVAKVFAWIQIVASLGCGAIMFVQGILNFKYMGIYMFWGPVTAILGCFMAWLSVICLYGFGQLVDDISALRSMREEEDDTHRPSSLIKGIDKSKEFRCPKCGGTVYYGESACRSCRQKFEWSNFSTNTPPRCKSSLDGQSDAGYRTTRKKQARVNSGIKCICGERYYEGRICPNCGRENPQ